MKDELYGSYKNYDGRDEEIKKIENPFGFLLDSGLLFEINRAILNPFGLAMEVTQDLETGEVSFHAILDYRKDEEGIFYGEKKFKIGQEKLENFYSENKERTEVRKKKLGFIKQGKDILFTDNLLKLPVNPN